jgi:hypothetical protein
LSHSSIFCLYGQRPSLRPIPSPTGCTFYVFS